MEWVQFDQDTFDGLGAHSNGCSAGSNPSSGRINEFLGQHHWATHHTGSDR